MYDDQHLRLPKDAADFWVLIRHHFDFARIALEETLVETREDALGLAPLERQELVQRLRYGLGLVKYRDSDENGTDQRDYFLEMGRELCPIIEDYIEREEFNMDFAQQWGKFMFCHGFIASYILDEVDSFTQIRGGRKTGQARSKDAQRQWLSHLLLTLIDTGVTRGKAEFRVARYISSLNAYPVGFDAAWFNVMVRRGELVATYDEKHLSVKRMREFALMPTDGIPPVPSQIP